MAVVLVVSERTQISNPSFIHKTLFHIQGVDRLFTICLAPDVSLILQLSILRGLAESDSG